MRRGEAVAMAALLMGGCYLSHGADPARVDGDAGRGTDAAVPIGDAGARDAVVPPPLDAPGRFALNASTAFFTLANGRFYAAGATDEGPGGRWGNLGLPRAEAPPFTFARYEGPQRFAEIAAGQPTTCGRTRGFEVFCWGTNAGGALGLGLDDTGHVEPEPTRLALYDVTQLSAGNLHFCALDAGGAITCWGYNASGQLGIGSRMPAGAPRPVAAGTRWREVSAGYDHTCAIRRDGALFCWGAGANGELGLGDPEERFEPTRVGTESDWEEIRAGIGHTCGIRDGGRLFCWGQNVGGESGVEGERLVLVPNEIEGRGWHGVTVGQFHSCALRGDGDAARAFCFGSNVGGELGVPDLERSATPVALPGEGWTSIEASWTYGCGVRGGEPLCWGTPVGGDIPLFEDMALEPRPIALAPLP